MQATTHNSTNATGEAIPANMTTLIPDETAASAGFTCVTTTPDIDETEKTLRFVRRLSNVVNAYTGDSCEELRRILVFTSSSVVSRRRRAPEVNFLRMIQFRLRFY